MRGKFFISEKLNNAALSVFAVSALCTVMLRAQHKRANRLHITCLCFNQCALHTTAPPINWPDL